VLWNEHAADSKLFSNTSAMERCGTAEGDQCAREKILSALDRMHPCRIGHVLVDHLADAECSMLGCKLERSANPLGGCPLGALNIEAHLPARECRRIDAAEHHISICYGGLPTATTVTDGARIGARAVRADDDPSERVDACDRAPTGTDLDHFDDRNAQ